MRILGVDYGERKVGLAISEGPLAEPLTVIRSPNVVEKISKICQTDQIDKIIIGVSEGKTEKLIREFARLLGRACGLKVEFQDETLTSREALAKMREIGKRIKDEDAIAAALILQAYLDKNV